MKRPPKRSLGGFRRRLFDLLPERTKTDINRIGLRYWLQLFFIQRILRINSHVPWPCHWSSSITGVDRIRLKTFPPYPGLGNGQYIQATNGIHIGRNVRLGPGVKLISANHDVCDFERHPPGPPIVIGDNCWLGTNAAVLPGVELADHVIVATGAVVTKSVSDSDVVVAGVPARVVKKIDPYIGGLPKNVTILDGDANEVVTGDHRN